MDTPMPPNQTNPMKVLVLYISKYGSTERYAKILQSELQADIVNLASEKPSTFASYDAILLAGAVYASGVGGIDFLRKNYGNMKGKKLAVLCVGASPFDEEALEEVKAKNLKKDLKQIPFFYARGAWDESKMSMKDQILCKMLKRFINKKDPATFEPWMKAFAESMGKQCDWVDEKYVEPLIEYIRG